MADCVCRPILELVQRGDLSPEQGLEALVLSAANQTADLRPDPTSEDFWALVGYCAALTAVDVGIILLKVAEVVAAVKRVMP